MLVHSPYVIDASCPEAVALKPSSLSCLDEVRLILMKIILDNTPVNTSVAYDSNSDFNIPGNT